MLNQHTNGRVDGNRLSNDKKCTPPNLPRPKFKRAPAAVVLRCAQWKNGNDAHTSSVTKKPGKRKGMGEHRQEMGKR